MRPTELATALRVIRPTKRPVMVWGQPGVGKSSIVRQDILLAKRKMIDWRLALMQEVDLRGIPSLAKHPQDSKLQATHWNPPAELPREPGWDIFIDEMVQGATPVINAARQLILDRALGSYELPEDCWIIAAGNLEGDRAATNRMPSHVANSFIHLRLDIHTDDWLAFAEAHDFDPRVFAYIKWRREHLHVFDPASKEKAFATPRAWEFVSQILRSLDASKTKLSKTELLEIIAGIIGKQVATEFVGFIDMMDKLVNLDEIKIRPEKVAVPDDAAVLYALSYALAGQSDARSFAPITTYVGRMKNEHQFLFMKQVQMKHPELLKSKEFIAWAKKNKDFI